MSMVIGRSVFPRCVACCTSCCCRLPPVKIRL
jgi:hypothetical protein